MRVSLSGYKFIFPAKCACCSGRADVELAISAARFSGKRVVHSNTKVWDVPYCNHCLNHIKTISEAAIVARGLMILAAVVACALWFFVAASIGLLVGILGIVGAIIARNHKIAEARSMSSPTCASAEAAISYLGWYGTVHQFEIGSLDFAREFMVANQSKLVNLSSEAQELLASSGVIPKPDAPRSARRYVT